MSYATPAPGQSNQGSDPDIRGRGRILIPTIVVIVVLTIITVIFTGLYTDWLWFKSVDNTSVYTTQLSIKIGLFVGFGLIMAAGIALSMIIAYRTRPMQRLRTPEQLSLERYRAGVEPLRKPLAFIVPAAIGLLAGVSASAEWQTWSLWRNQQPFGSTDPQFDVDIGFYMFSYPWLRFLLGFSFTLILVALLCSVVVHYLYGGIRLQLPGPRVSDAAQTHISILLGILCLLKAAAYWLDRYGLALKSESSLAGGITGLKYRDLNALLPAKSILVGIALICAVLFFVNAFRRSWSIALSGFGLLVVSALVIGGIYPAIVQQFQVKPSELTKEAPSIQKNIDATRSAYGLNNVQVEEYDASTQPNKATLATQQGTLDGIRIVDPAVVSPTFRALQQVRGYYSFPDTLDIDRYPIAGKERGAVVAVRDLNLDGIPANQRNWANDHLVYTHGYGFVGAFDSEKTTDGQPVFFEKDIPPIGPLTLDQPRVYFGEDTPLYSIVGGPAGSEAREIDAPDTTAPNGQKNNTYDGSGGVPVGSAFDRALFAIKFQEPNILLSSLINEESKIMWDRDPADMVAKVAPWLRLDSDPYPVVDGGRIKWIVDGYTTSNEYPFSSRVTATDAISDSTITKTGPLAAPRDEINYIRNSVKAVVDSFDGSVNLYGWDPADPVLQTWEKVFPGVVKDKSEMSPELTAHVRYPSDAFKIQRLIFSRYHVTDPGAFYSGQDFWVVPTDPTQKQVNPLYQPPYYLNLQMPSDEAPKFSLTTTYAPVNRQTLAAFMSADSTPGAGFGQFRVLQLPRNTTIPGPAQVQNNFEANPAVSSQLSLLRQGGSEVDLGNLLSLPVGDGMLYVEPVYIRSAASSDAYPLLQRILVGFGDQVAMRENLPDALAAVGVIAGPGGKPGPGGKIPPVPVTPLQTQLTEALTAAQKAYSDGEAALKAGDFAAYGVAQKALAEALKKAVDVQAEINKGAVATAPVTPAAQPASALRQQVGLAPTLGVGSPVLH